MPGRKLLVADDSLTIQKVIRLALSNEGYEIQAVSDGGDAVQQISLFRPDIVLVDVSLPGKSAFELKREINQLTDLHETRFVLMSSAFESVDEVQAAEVKFHGRLTKPFDPAHLRQVLNEVLNELAARRDGPTQSTKRPLSAAPPPLPTSFAPPAPPPLPDIQTQPSPVIPPRLSAFAAAPPPPLPVHAPPPLPPSAEEFERPPPLMDLSAHLSYPPLPADTDDIKHLTESTIKMSGLLEGGQGEAPSVSIPPAPPSSGDDFGWSVNEPSLKPPSRTLDDGGTNFELDLRGPFQSLELEDHPSRTNIQRPSPVSAVAGSATAAVLDEALREEVRRQIQAMLPDVAEKVIKEEIHRMLSEKF